MIYLNIEGRKFKRRREPWTKYWIYGHVPASEVRKYYHNFVEIMLVNSQSRKIEAQSHEIEGTRSGQKIQAPSRKATGQGFLAENGRDRHALR